jgi:hypothetical protein
MFDFLLTWMLGKGQWPVLVHGVGARSEQSAELETAGASHRGEAPDELTGINRSCVTTKQAIRSNPVRNSGLDAAYMKGVQVPAKQGDGTMLR